jgi:hypothetical protein
VFSVHVKTMLSTCHVVRIEAAQMEVLPDWEELSQAHDFAHDLNLPFEPLLLDFEGVGGIAPQMIVKMHEEIESVLVLRGALVSRINEAGALTILPFGDLYLPDVDADSVVTKTARQKALGQDDSSVHPYTPMGSLVFDTIDTGEDRPKFGPQEMAVESGGEHSRKMRSVTTAINTELLGGSPTGMVVLPHQWKDSDRGRMDAIEGWAHATYAAGLRALAALSIMESDFVVVEQADLEHRDIKRAEKRGWKISDQVYVRPTRKGGHYEPTGNTRNYSHRFWVRGHMKHYSLGTRAATHRPDLVKPCTRAGLASCGMCRRIWTPPFIKGPEDKPLVMKSLVKKVE